MTFQWLTGNVVPMAIKSTFYIWNHKYCSLSLEWEWKPSVVSDPFWPHGLYSPWTSPGQNTGVGSLSLLQEIFPTQASNSGLPHCRWILYQLSHKGSPRILEWVAYPFSSGSSNPGIEIGFPAFQADSLPTELSGNDDEFQLFLLRCIFMPSHLSPCYLYTWT